MFWPLVLPFKLTCLFVAISFVLFVMIASKKKWKMAKALSVFSITSMVAFIPSCTTIQLALDQFRFGHFKYEDYEQLKDRRIRRYMPDKACNITIHKHYSGNGYVAAFSINREQLTKFLDANWQSYGEYSSIERGGISIPKLPNSQSTDLVSWEACNPSETFHSPIGSNGSGAMYWFCPAKELAYVDAGYW